jgi:hypothetical protein
LHNTAALVSKQNHITFMTYARTVHNQIGKQTVVTVQTVDIKKLNTNGYSKHQTCQYYTSPSQHQWHYYKSRTFKKAAELCMA